MSEQRHDEARRVADSSSKAGMEAALETSLAEHKSAGKELQAGKDCRRLWCPGLPWPRVSSVGHDASPPAAQAFEL